MKAPPYPVAVNPIYDWSGFYLGGYSGVAFGKSAVNDLTDPALIGIGTASSTSFAGGVLAGYNVQVNAFVGGAEAEIGYNGLDKSGTYLSSGGGTRSYEFTSDYIARARLRAGYAVNTWLFYAAGGVSGTNEELALSNPGSGFGQSLNKGLLGFNAGVGTEYAMTQNMQLRLEYVFDDFGSKTYGFYSGGNTFDSRTVKFTQNTARAAVEYKF